MSAKEIVRSSTGLRTLAILSDNQLPGHRLDIEITETAFLEDMDAAINTIESLKLAGVSIALDDFGTGHASLGYVEKINLDKLKVDRSFVTDIPNNPRSQEIVKAIVTMCRELQIKCIVEGVETEAELETLRRLGCRYMQGFLFAKPMSQPEVLEFLSNLSAGRQLSPKDKLAS